jgi:uncharacterized protein (DUF433 family)
VRSEKGGRGWFGRSSAGIMACADTGNESLGCAMPAILDGHIEMTEGTRGGKPRISGTRIAVADVVIMHFRLNQSLEEIAGVYDLPLAGVHAALTYYYDHRTEIDESITAEEAYAEAFQRANPSLLRAKLRALGGE